MYTSHDTADLLSPWAAFAVVWGLGATCDYKSRCIFSDWLKKVQKDAQHKTPFPEDGLVFDYRYKLLIFISKNGNIMGEKQMKKIDCLRTCAKIFLFA